jgi:hypothetical protein
MALNGWSSAQMLTDYGASERSARARSTYDEIMIDGPLLPAAAGCPLASHTHHLALTCGPTSPHFERQVAA